MSKMVKIVIDERPLEVKEGLTILQAAGNAGIHIPHLCYHPAFPPEGSCRMCLVEIEGYPKLELACSTKVREGMKISVSSPGVAEARKAVLEFLLAEHPLDCPICDKAGECRLQDYYEEFGLFEGRFNENKEKKEKKVSIGKHLLLDRERCILCNRCIRFLKEVTASEELGVFNRGIHSEISVFDNLRIDGNYSGNLAELCPVGAITDSDFRFKSRTWFLEKGESICPLCSRGCNIFIDYRRAIPRVDESERVFRIRARENDRVNRFWICDVGRYGYGHLGEDRIVDIVMNKSGRKTVLSWDKALMILVEKIKTLHFMKKTSRIAVILDTWLSNEELFLIKKIFQEDLKVGKIFVADPGEGAADAFLLTAERTPNRRGAGELGFDFQPPDPETFFQNTDILLVFGRHTASASWFSRIKESLDRIGTKLLFTTSRSGLNSLVDIVLPTTQIAEKQGSLTNCDGLVQRFAPVLAQKGDALPEWQILVRLGKELNIRYRTYHQFSTPDKILKEMGKEIPFFKAEQ